MTVTEVTGDLFALDLPAIGHGCNCQGSMGAGVAVEFRRRYPDMYAEYRRRCRTGRFELGEMFVWEAEDRVIYNLATQPAPGPTASLVAIEQSVRAALADALARGLGRLGVPRIGSGLGGLCWHDVMATLRRAASLETVELVVVTLPSAT